METLASRRNTSGLSLQDAFAMVDFEIRPLSGITQKALTDKTEYCSDSPVRLDHIVGAHFQHYGFENNMILTGEVHVHENVAKNVLEIFKALFEIKFAIEMARPIDRFDGDDVLSMEANNSSAFNPRRIMNTDRWSSHAYGMAIDINPRQNPYVLNPNTENEEIFPNGGEHFLDRSLNQQGMVESVVSIFAKHGFDEWGGSWKSPLDYHHFQVGWKKIKGID